MKTLYLDCGMGAAGDMLTAALFELLDENEKKEFLNIINSLGIEGAVVSADKMTKCGINGTHFSVSIGGVEESEHHHHEHDHDHEHHHHEHDHDHEHHHHEHDHDHEHHHHEHDHDHEHHHHEHEHHHHEHHHSGMKDIVHIINNLPVSDKVKGDIAEVYRIIAEAESYVHGVEIKDIHFHEVGTMDAVIDVASVCILMEKLGVERIISSAVHVGSGHVHCAHGVLPVPAPATAYILRDVPIYSGEIKSELCTPTGAALLKYFVNEFAAMPVMKVKKIGYGMGKKDFSAANCVRVMLGTQVGGGDEIIELECNVDDMTAERMGFAMDCLFEKGALEVYTIPVGMKKSRPGTMLCVMCRQSKRDEIVKAIFRYTTTLGVREIVSKRYTLERKVVTEETCFGEVRVKYSKGYGVERKKYEYDDLVKIAKERGISIDEVVGMIEDENRRGN